MILEKNSIRNNRSEERTNLNKVLSRNLSYPQHGNTRNGNVLKSSMSRQTSPEQKGSDVRKDSKPRIITRDYGNIQIKSTWSHDLSSEKLNNKLAQAAALGDIVGANKVLGEIKNSYRSKDIPRALESAIKHNQKEMISFLSTRGALYGGMNFHEPVDNTPLHIAVKYSTPDTVKFIIDMGAKVNVVNELGYTPLALAEFEGKTNVADILIANGAALQIKSGIGSQPISEVIVNNNFERADYYLSKGVNINGIDYSKRSVLHNIAEFGSYEAVDYVLGKNPKINLKDDGQKTPLFLSMFNRKNSYAIMQRLIQAGATVNEPDMYGITPLSRAIQHGDMGAAKILISNGADCKIKDLEGNTALHHSSEGGRVTAINLLLDSKNNLGTDINQTNNKGETPLYVAIKNMHSSVASLLISKGAEVNTELSPLHQASKNRMHDVAIDLVNHGANPNIMDSKGKTPLYVAVHNNDKVLKNELLKVGAKFSYGRKKRFMTRLNNLLR